MADSKQLTILKRLTGHLQGVTPANGYDYDLSESVFRGRAVFGADDPIPMLSILEFPKQEVGSPAAELGRKQSVEWDLLLQGWAEDDADNPSDPAYALKAEVEFRLSDIIATINGDPKFPDAYLLGNLVTEFGVCPGVVRPPDGQVSAKAFFYIPLKIKFVTDIGKRFSAA